MMIKSFFVPGFLLLIILYIATATLVNEQRVECHEEDFEDFRTVTPTTEEEKRPLNNRPIIGIIAHECCEKKDKDGKIISKKMLYLPACHVKFVEGGGGRVVPIFANRGEPYLRHMFDSVNGIMFPGGLVNLGSSEYGKAGRFLYKLAIDANDKGNYFPLWGECLGLQFMLHTAANSPKRGLRSNCGMKKTAASLNFTGAADQSRLFKYAGKKIKRILESGQNVTSHNHRFCVTLSNFEDLGLHKVYDALSLNWDAKSRTTFVSSVEAKNYPFYALAFHPEVTIYEFRPRANDTMIHSGEAIEVAQYFERFFVNEARKNFHKFETEAEEIKNLIYNYHPIYTGTQEGARKVQTYYFPFYY